MSPLTNIPSAERLLPPVPERPTRNYTLDIPRCISSPLLLGLSALSCGASLYFVHKMQTEYRARGFNFTVLCDFEESVGFLAVGLVGMIAALAPQIRQ